MKPADLRRTHFSEIARSLTRKRRQVYDQLLQRAPSTALELAHAMGWPVTSVRPRLTELKDAFFVVPTGDRRHGEYVFRALTDAEATHLRAIARQAVEEEARRQAAAAARTADIPGQLLLIPA